MSHKRAKLKEPHNWQWDPGFPLHSIAICTYTKTDAVLNSHDNGQYDIEIILVIINLGLSLRLMFMPLMYFLELQNIIFAIKSFKSPSESFDINNYISFSTGSTRSGSNSKLAHHHAIAKIASFMECYASHDHQPLSVTSYY